MTDVVVTLPEALRPELKEPMGPVFSDAEDLLAGAGPPVVAVGDVVTYHLLSAGVTPAVALVDERTEREAVDEEVAATNRTAEGFDRTLTADNPAAALSAELLAALDEAIEEAAETSTLLAVDGEEDLAVLPAVVFVPEGATVVYGQPGEGMVRVTVDATLDERVRDLLFRMDGDDRRLRRLLD